VVPDTRLVPDTRFGARHPLWCQTPVPACQALLSLLFFLRKEMSLSYSIKEVSEKTGLPLHVLRYYEHEGLLPGVARNRSGIRSYSENDLELLSLICCLKNTGMSIKQIKSFVELSVEGDATLQERCDLLREHKKNVEAKILEVQKHLQKVTHKIEYFSKKSLPQGSVD
jgi:DNA-binding transcriptional MerR regulator